MSARKDSERCCCTGECDFTGGKDYADETMKNFHKFGKASISVKDMEAERARLREKIKENDSRTAKAAPKPKKKLKSAALHIGDRVRVLSLNLEGTVSTLPNPKGDLFVQMGIPPFTGQHQRSGIYRRSRKSAERHDNRRRKASDVQVSSGQHRDQSDRHDRR